jgi:hypothetical protein
MVIYTSIAKREHWAEHIVPVNDLANVPVVAAKYGVKPEGVLAWYSDGKEHWFCGKRIPVIVMHPAMGIFGVNEEILYAAGYAPHWVVFEDLDTGEFSFGNRSAFIKSRVPAEVARGYAMPVIDFAEIAES